MEALSQRRSRPIAKAAELPSFFRYANYSVAITIFGTSDSANAPLCDTINYL
jgi:hypothetical protein